MQPGLALKRLFRADLGLRIVLPAFVVLVATVATVISALGSMAYEANHIEEVLTEQSASAAVQTVIRAIGRSHNDYAQWDDAVRALYGSANDDFINQNYAASTTTAMFFDTVYLLDEQGHDVFGFRNGEKLTESAAEVFGPRLARMIAKLPDDGRTYGVEAGLLPTKWGLASVAVGPVVPNTPEMQNPPARSRMLVIAKSFDAAAVTRLGENYVIDNLRLADISSPGGIVLTDPDGEPLARLAWTSRYLGSEAQAKVGPVALTMLALLTLTMAGLILRAVQALRHIRRSETAARYAASHDPLTGLPNRSALLAATEAAIEITADGGLPCALAYLDIDGFKEINDAYGHATGDRLLRLVAERFQSVGAGNLLARLGGDEFALLLPGDNARKEACAFASRAIESLKNPFDIDGRSIVIGSSVGVAVSRNERPSAEEMLRRADVAMYQAKQEGPNRYFVYDPVVDRVRSERIGLANDLRRAIANNELSVVYQPVFDAGSRKMVAAEALLRWTSPIRGAIPATIFIPLAEETGLIDEIGVWALRQACIDSMRWPEIRLCVNVSPAQFRGENFDSIVASTLAATGFPAERLELEVTETYFLTHPEQARTAIAALRRLGTTVALDDFGTGYSSIGYLRRFKFDKLKLDRSLLINIATDERAQQLLNATIVLANALGLRVTAEGVETETEAVLLRAAGCHEFQGFLFEKPISPARLTEILAYENSLSAPLPARSA